MATSEGLELLYESSLDCVHCGLCLPVCPTYRETGRETSSPRGRIYLWRAVAEGRISIEGTAADEAYLCLGCRACETACPSGVRFGRLIERARAEVERSAPRRGLAAKIERFALGWIVPAPRLLSAAVTLLALVQRLGLDRLARLVAPGSLRELLDAAPRIPPRAERAALPELIPAEGERRGRVALFVGCIMPELFGRVNHATARVLARNGFDVVVVPGQGCCGALHAHSGDSERANELARRNVAAFGAAGVDAVVVNSAGCGAALRDLDDWIPGEGASLAGAVRDVSEFLMEAGLRAPTGELRKRVCYDDPCHLVHGQRVADAPRELLRAIPGLELVPHADPGSCCGAAGIYNLTHREMSRAILEKKLVALAAADPDVVATGNPGCIMQLQNGARLHGLRARIVHPVELLDEAYGGAG